MLLLLEIKPEREEKETWKGIIFHGIQKTKPPKAIRRSIKPTCPVADKPAFGFQQKTSIKTLWAISEPVVKRRSPRHVERSKAESKHLPSTSHAYSGIPRYLLLPPRYHKENNGMTKKICWLFDFFCWVNVENRRFFPKFANDKRDSRSSGFTSKYNIIKIWEKFLLLVQAA